MDRHPRELENDVRDAEALLMRARPRARDAFVAATEAHLVGGRRARRRSRPVVLAGALASTLAAGVVVAGLVAGFPWQSSEQALATNPCPPAMTAQTVKPGGSLVLKKGQPTVATAAPAPERAQSPCR